MELSASKVPRYVAMTVVLSNLVVVVAIWLVSRVLIILIRIPPSRAMTMTVVTLWLHGSIVVVWLLVVSTLIAHISLWMCLIEVVLVAIVGIDIESPGTVMPCERTIEVG